MDEKQIKKKRLKQTRACRKRVRLLHKRIKPAIHTLLRNIETELPDAGPSLNILRYKLSRLSCYNCEHKFLHRLVGSCSNTYEYNRSFFDIIDDIEVAENIKTKMVTLTS